MVGTMYSFPDFVFSIRCSTEKKSNYLKALSNIVTQLPKQVQISELPAVSSSSLTVLSLKINEVRWFENWLIISHIASVSVAGSFDVSRSGCPAVHAVLPRACPPEPVASFYPAAGGFGQQVTGPHLQSGHGECSFC